MSKRAPRVLYHYCSLSTFMSIFDNKSIWLSDIRRSNDSLELRWIMGQCQYYMINAWTDYVRDVQQNRGMDIVSHEHFKEFEDLYLLAKDYDAENDTKNGVFCLSEKADDLGQWRGYANDGQGISIGFNSAFLRKINLIGDAVRTTSVNFCFDKVHYSQKDIKTFFYDRVGLAKIDNKMEPNEVIQYMKRALALSYIFSPLYKSDKFRDEKEWRIFYSMYLEDMEKGERPGIPTAKNAFSDMIRLEKYKFERKGETMVSHMELELPQLERAINSIIIGPKAKVTPMDMRLYLMSIGLLKDANDESIKIHRSMISYR